MFVPSANSTSSTAFGTASLVATEVNSDVKPVANSASLRMSIRSMVPQRRSISAFSATRFSGSSCLPGGETLIHGSPCFVTMSTPPVVPSSSAASKRVRASRSLFSRASRNFSGSCGWRIAS
ncbi:hypothetical protein SAMN05216532_0117 [Streptomyces sp. 2231.1]|nr:hypothetical protein SAMN05216532_0117 [Streptomyces sp. 2231.1]